MRPAGLRIFVLVATFWLGAGPVAAIAQSESAQGGQRDDAFQALDAQHFFVLDRDDILRREAAPAAGNSEDGLPVDANLFGFHALDEDDILVLDKSSTLWLDRAPFGSIPPAREHVADGVFEYAAVTPKEILIVHFGGALTLESLDSSPRVVTVDSHVDDFRLLDDGAVLVIDHDRDLWLERLPSARLPARRTKVDSDVILAWGVGENTFFVKDNSNHLWVERASSDRKPPARSHVDDNVEDFAGINAAQVLVRVGEGNALWLERGPFGGDLQAKVEVEPNVWTYQTLGSDAVVLSKTDGTVWLERAPYGAADRFRQQIYGPKMFDPVTAVGSALVAVPAAEAIPVQRVVRSVAFVVGLAVAALALFRGARLRLAGAFFGCAIAIAAIAYPSPLSPPELRAWVVGEHTIIAGSEISAPFVASAAGRTWTPAPLAVAERSVLVLPTAGLDRNATITFYACNVAVRTDENTSCTTRWYIHLNSGRPVVEFDPTYRETPSGSF